MNDDIDLIYSPDDNGFYFQDYSKDIVSRIYRYFTNALIAFEHNEINWVGD